MPCSLVIVNHLIIYYCVITCYCITINVPSNDFLTDWTSIARQASCQILTGSALAIFTAVNDIHA